jgi:septum site-determining protein MinC
MSKIAIISRPDQGVLIDVTGCSTMQEAVEHMSSTLQVGSQFWKGLAIDLNLGNLKLNGEEVLQLLAIAKGLGVVPKEVFSEDSETVAALKERGIKIGYGQPMTLSTEKSKAMSQSEHAEVSSLQPSDERGDAQEIDTTGRRIIMYDGEDIFAISADEAGASDSEGDKLAPQVFLESNSKVAGESVLYLKQTLRSGQAVSHKGHLVIIGDVNAGAEVVAEGDITIWGCLRGVAHAGLGGNCQAEIRALKLQPIQIRIADSIARSPDPRKAGQSTGWGPESARLVDGKIRILRNTLD